MAQISPKQTITFSIDGILSSGSEEANLRRNREICSKVETIPSRKAITNDDGNNKRGDKSPDILTSVEKQPGQFDSIVFVVCFKQVL